MFDGFVEVPGETLDQGVRRLADLGDKPSLAALSYALRHPEMWPKGFEWDYSFCHSCAMGLTVQLWPDTVSSIPHFDPDSGNFFQWKATLQPLVGINQFKFDDIFMNVNRQLFDPDGNENWKATAPYVEPWDVADAIDAYLATAE
jgi:hypothetical protein